MKDLKIFALLVLAFLLSACEKPPTPARNFTNLFDAAKSGEVDAIRLLLVRGNKVDEIDSYGRTPLVYAVMGHHLDAVKILIASGAKKEVVTSKGYDLVMLSLYNEMDDSLDILNYLVNLGLGVNRTTAEGDSALNIAISSKHEKAVARLISLGAVPNQKSKEILESQTQPNAEIVRLIDAATSSSTTSQGSR
ncbi:ankyrin repeat domain-containing protein [Pseudoduganella chitinolytica]|uniref:Ankyrin repeat domain-containing protein n=1 Tax=Pseudoduganella chitinolytica TaxID=34070 RepID=A0ABY8B9Z9_9BURK|nr:ankyrin repeat domain-containing protein [Pseudoduganella chitinolytica]WEF31821.1 ankyrin repeat domain-containing protein [Pseudoduganella chitinolytica]